MRRLDTDHMRRKREKLEAELEALRTAERSADDERRVIVGRVILEHARTNPDFAEMLNHLLDGSVTKRNERFLLGLTVTERRRRKQGTEETSPAEVSLEYASRDEPSE